MNKQEIARIIEKGSPKARMKLLAEHYALVSSGDLEGLITPDEYDLLLSKLSKRFADAFVDYSRIMTHGIQLLQTVYYSAARSLSDLQGYVILWESIQAAEKLVNIVLEELPDEKARFKAINKIMESRAGFLLSSNAVTGKGYLKILVGSDDEGLNNPELWHGDLGFELTEEGVPMRGPYLIRAISNVRRDLIRDIATFKTYAAVVKDWMDKTGFKPKIYADRIKEWEDEILSDQALWEKYNYDADLSDSDNTDPANKYRVYPNPTKIDITEELYGELQAKLGIAEYE